MKKLEELKKKIENIEITYDYEESYNNLYNNVVDYMNETQDFDLDYLFNDFVDYEIAEEYIKHELDKGGLKRMKYAIGDTDFYSQEIFRIDAYGNLENIYKDDLDFLKEELLDRINEKLESEK